MCHNIASASCVYSPSRPVALRGREVCVGAQQLLVMIFAKNKNARKSCRCSVAAGHFLLIPFSVFVHRSRTDGATAMTMASAASCVYAPSRLVIVWAHEASLGPPKVSS